MIARYAPLVALVLLTQLGPLPALAQDTPSPAPSESPAAEPSPAASPADEPSPAAEPEPSGEGPASTTHAYQSFNPDISVIPSFVFGWFSGRGARNGAVQPVTGFNFSELEVGFQAPIDPFFRADIFTTWDPINGFSAEEAYLTALQLPWNLTARAGMFHSLFGRENSQHRHVWNFVDNSLVYYRLLGDEGFTDLGAEISWLAPLPWYMETILEVQQGSNGNIFGGTRGRDLLMIGTMKNSVDITDDTTVVLFV